LLPIARTC